MTWLWQYLSMKCSLPFFVRVQLCLAMQICSVQFYFLEPSWKWHKQHWHSSSQTSTAANCTVPAFQSAAYVTDPTTRKVLRGATRLNFQSSSVITLFSSTLKLDAIGCLNYYRCSRTNWDHYTLHQANFFPSSTVDQKWRCCWCWCRPPGQKKGLVQFPNCTRNLLSVPWCTNFAQFLRPPTAFAAGMLFHQDGGWAMAWRCDKNWWSTSK